MTYSTIKEKQEGKMARISHCVDCGVAVTSGKRGNLRRRCPKHKRQHHTALETKWKKDNPQKVKKWANSWYVSTRQGNPEWQAENKRRAKLWRKKNKDRVKQYDLRTGRVRSHRAMAA